MHATATSTRIGQPVQRKEDDRMKLPRRQFLRLAAGAATLPAFSRIATAQTYVRIV